MSAGFQVVCSTENVSRLLERVFNLARRKKSGGGGMLKGRKFD